MKQLVKLELANGGVQMALVKSFVIVLFILSSTTVYADASDSITKNFKNWAKPLLAAIENSLQMQRFKIDRQRIQATQKSSRLESPLSLTSRLVRTDKRPILNSKDTPSTESHSLNSEAKYQSASSLSAKINLENSYSEVKVPEIDAKFGSKKHRISAELNYDLLKGGESSLASIKQQIDYLSAKKSMIDLDAEILAYRISFYRAITDFYVKKCQFQSLKRSEVLVGKTLSATENKMKANLTPYTNYLTLKDLNLSILRRKATSTAEIESSRAVFLQYGENIFKILSDVENNIECTAEIDQLEIYKNVKPTEINVKLLPSVLSAELQKKIVFLSLKSEQVSDKLSVGPLVGGSYTHSPDDINQPEDGSFYIGASVNWTIPSRKSSLERLAAANLLRSSITRLEIAEASEKANITNIRSRMKLQFDILNTAKASLANSKELQSTLDTRFKAGIIDSVAFYNNQVSNIDSESSLLSAWSNFVSTENELREYQNYK